MNLEVEIHFGSESVKKLGAKIWDLIPVEIKASKYLINFKKKIKNWNPETFPCRLVGSILAKLVS